MKTIEILFSALIEAKEVFSKLAEDMVIAVHDQWDCADFVAETLEISKKEAFIFVRCHSKEIKSEVSAGNTFRNAILAAYKKHGKKEEVEKCKKL